MAFVRTALIIVGLMLGWTAVRAHPVETPPAAGMSAGLTGR